ncbi:hypothetical protein [Streptomyces chilikensis]|uniref:Integral membrane protein n=1 Tax=Streptomyces chilikensis TaxID=1194079 RepID=A0ABV3EVQ8_9ACTN|nr:hypothetical protein [Streptomyces chilikensis]
MTPRTSRLRDVLSAALTVAACLLLPFGALAAWAAYGIADTGRYVTAMAPLSSDPAVRGAVADTVGAGIMHELAQRRGLPPSAAPYVHSAVRSFTRTETFRAVWDAGNRASHEAVLKALRERREGPVTVDLAPITAQVRHELADGDVPLAGSIPVRHARLAVLEPDELRPLRVGFRTLEVAGVWLPVSAGVLAGAGIAVAVRRRRAVTATALGTAVGGALLGVALLVGRATVLADLPPGVSRPAVAAVYDALTTTLRHVAWGLFALGLLVAAVTWLTRRRTVARLTARRPAPPTGAPAPPAGSPSASPAAPPPVPSATTPSASTAPPPSGARPANPSLPRRVVD